MLLGFAQILIFLSFPTQDSERLPAVATQQIAFAFSKREKLRLSNREKHQRNFKKISPNKR
jgi:glutamate synthase domain-containing protein 3